MSGDKASAGITTVIIDRLIRSRYPHFEQGGFVEAPSKQDCVLRLHMAGGEFCGNAVRCLAALITDDYANCRRLESVANYSLISESQSELHFAIEISGASQSLPMICSTKADQYLVTATMPFIKEFSSISEKQILLENQLVKSSIVNMEGITHILINEADFIFVSDSKRQRNLVDAVLDQCGLQTAPAVGLIWYSLDDTTFSVNPIVWVHDIDTCIFESACGSGSLALALALLKRSQQETKSYSINQPSGAALKITASKSNKKNEFISARAEGLVSIKSLLEIPIII